MTASSAAGAKFYDPQSERVFEIIRSLAAELHLPVEHWQPLRHQSRFDRDLGLDSLTRVELIARIERQFQVLLPEQAYRELNTVGELMTALATAPKRRSAAPDRAAAKVAEPEATMAAVTLPTAAATLVEVLDWHAEQHANRRHLTLYEAPDTPVSFSGLQISARRVALSLQGRGLQHGDVVALMLPTSLEYFFCFFGILQLGAIPVPIYPPARFSQLEEHLRRHAAILNNCAARLLIVAGPTRTMAQLLRFQVARLEAIVTAEELLCASMAKWEFATPTLTSHDTAFLQYTSGSTGHPKGVILSHANILANLRAMGDAVQVTPADVFVSWLPLYHDMGLIGAWFGSLYYAAHFVAMSPFQFLSRPVTWLQALQHYRGTITSAPNFAFELCLLRLAEQDLLGLDLSSVRVMCNGAEAVSPVTIERFIQQFSRYRLKPEAVLPVYGLAENTVGLAFPPLGRAPRIDVIERESFQRKHRAIPVSEAGISVATRARRVGVLKHGSTPSDPKSLTITNYRESAKNLSFVACGRPLPGHEIRIVDDNDHELPERYEGHLQFRGPSATESYWQNPQETAKLLHKNREIWLDSGDLAYWAEGDLFITGRVKDVIKHAGRNIYPEELESAIGELIGIRRGCVAVFGSADPKLGTERLVVLAETRETLHSTQQEIRTRINAEVARIIGSAPDHVALAAPHTVLKTSSGKLRRAASKALFEAGRVQPPGSKAQRRASLRWQLVRFMLGGIPLQIERIFNFIWIRSRALWMYASVAVLMLLLWPLVLLLPTVASRWWITRLFARLICFVTHIRVRVLCYENLPEKPVIYVANHTSYVDVLALVLALPRPVSFAAKVELARFAPLRWFFGRLETEYVARFEQAQSLRDVHKLALVAASGKSLLFFPEGTFGRCPGLLPFYLGAFQTAVEASRPIVPIAIKGARSILHHGSWIARPGHVTVTILPAIVNRSTSELGGDDAWDRAIWLRDAARASILECNGEPDLRAALSNPITSG